MIFEIQFRTNCFVWRFWGILGLFPPHPRRQYQSFLPGETNIKNHVFYFIFWVVLRCWCICGGVSGSWIFPLPTPTHTNPPHPRRQCQSSLPGEQNMKTNIFLVIFMVENWKNGTKTITSCNSRRVGYNVKYIEYVYNNMYIYLKKINKIK